MLHALFGSGFKFTPGIEWKAAAPGLRGAIIAALDKAGDPACRPFAAAVLGDLLGHADGPAIREDAEVSAAMDAARAAIEQAGTADDKAAVLRGTALAPDEAVSGPAFDQLYKLFTGGALTPAARHDAIRKIESAVHRSSPVLRQYLLKLLADDEAPLSVRRSIVRGLARSPEMRGPLVNTLSAAITQRRPNIDMLWELHDFLAFDLRKNPPENTEPPPWLLKLAGLCRSLMNDTRFEPEVRARAVSLYYITGLPQAKQDIVALALDPQTDPEVGVGAIRAFAFMGRTISGPAEFATRFADFRPELRREIIRLVSEHGTAALQDSVFLKALKDDAMRYEVRGTIGSLSSPFSPELEAAIKARADDPVLKYEVKQLLDKQAKTAPAKQGGNQ